MYINSTKARVAQAEEKGRNIFINIHSGMTWTTNTERYGVWDLSGSTLTTKMYNEIKSRNLSSKDYRTTFLEVKKYQNLIDLAKVNGGKAFYFVTFNDNVSYLFDLFKIKPNQYPVIKRWCNDVTIGDDEPRWVLKDIIELPLKDAARMYS